MAVGGAGFGQVGFQLARYRRDGSLDPTFGDAGKIVTRYHGANGRAVAIQRNGRIVVAGYNTRGLALARYRPDGRLDRSFDGDGTVGPVVGEIFALAVAVAPNGRIVVGGDFDIFAFGMARFRSDGRVDPSFGHDGVVRIHASGGEQGANGLVIQPDGRIIATGSSGPHEFGDPTIPRFVMLRVLANGRRDATFGMHGVVKTSFDGGAAAHGSAVDLEGRVVMVGGSGEGSNDTFAIARYVVGPEA